ncbi:hypothetical protein [Nocardioides ungokensis]|uniref:hypothetical protein n=1 Tax=Nocardioides ungokensis TaxID=1643322 RepID=UPI001FEB7715|nr:hypothetical protein [Nocardioides ungokensis]
MAILIGYAILAISRIFHLNDKPPVLNWRSAVWLPPYLIGMGIIVYVSTFGPGGWLHLWWDMLVVAVFSMIIYFWAMQVGLPAEQIEEMISEVVLPEEEGLAAPEHTEGR